MNGHKFFADTNILLYLLAGDETLAGFLDGKQIHISFITQLELLGYSSITLKEKKVIEALLSNCIVTDINNPIKTKTIELSIN